MLNRRSFSVILTIVVVLLAIFAFNNQQAIEDNIKYWSYQPTSEISRLADRSGMSDKGRFYFYVARPQLESANQFNQDCRSSERSSPILGCYLQGADTIHIYNVDNKELDGVKEVTAAHEMLHVVFERLSSGEKQELSDMLEDAYKKLKTPKLEKRMAEYAESQPGSRTNELHSIIGTEFRSIGGELEEYYGKYFSNRLSVVSLSEGYTEKFDRIEGEAAALSDDLKVRHDRINKMADSYSADLAALNAKISSFNSRAQSGYFKTQEQFDAERGAILSESNTLDTRRAEIEQLSANYNRDVARLKELGVEIERLNRSLDSTQAVGN